FVARYMQRDYVTEFMPKDRLPIDRVPRMRRGPIGGDDAAEANAQITGIARHSEGTDSKIFLLGENFHDRLVFEIKPVFRAEIAARAAEQIQHLPAKHSGFMAAHAQNKIAV